MLAGAVGHDLGVGAGETGAVFAVALAAFTAGVLTAGPVADRHGARPLLAVAAVAATAGLGLAAAVPSVPSILVGIGLGFGGANGIGYAAALHVAGTVWPARRGMAIGVVIGAYALGAVAAAPLLAAVVEQQGWRRAVAGLAVVVAAAVTAAAALVPQAPPAPTRATDGDRARGRAAGGSRRVVLLWLVFGACSAPTLFTFAHAADAARARGLSVSAATTAVAILAGGNLAGRLAAGWAADRFGAPASLVLVTAASVAACAVLAAVPGGVVILPAFAVLGTTYGAVSALTPAATADAVGPDRLAGAYGKVFTSWGLAGLTAPVAGGWLTERTGSHDAAFLAGAIVAAVALAGALRLHRSGAAQLHDSLGLDGSTERQARDADR